jgi:puromycin-sensitive aminopeptidase
MSKYQLPKAIKPVNYSLEIKPDLTNFTFEGECVIDIDVLESTDTIELNGNEIEIIDYKLVLAGAVEIEGYSMLQEHEVIKFKFDEIIPRGHATLILQYKGVINDKLCGLYRGKQGDRYVISTQFEATDARRAFPCWDEPNFKATFELTLIHPKDMISLSNTDAEFTIEEEDLITIKYNKTPIMSTYLMAFYVGYAEYIEQTSTHGVRVRVWGEPGSMDKSEFALTTAIKCLDFFTDYFKIPYPLAKLDLLGVPEFDAGAMENWGLIIFRKYILQFSDSISEMQRITYTYIICHEIAHQWFGNLVTMDWWDDLWLNESFATWAGWMCVDVLHPKWLVWEKFYLDEYVEAMKLDVLKTSHPIEVHVQNPSDITEIFDAISYSKGSCIISMVAEFMGGELFAQGIHNYLKKYQYANATSADLWLSLDNISTSPIADMMGRWTKVKGFPLVEVHYDSCGITLIQKPFTANGDTLWIIPMINSHNGVERKLLFETETIVISNSLGAIDTNSMVKFNSKSQGFYITKYDESSLLNILSSIRKLTALDHIGIINDLFMLAKNNHCKVLELITFVSNYFIAMIDVNDISYLVWSALADYFAQIKYLFRNSLGTIVDDINAIIKCHAVPALDYIGWEFNADDAQSVTLKRKELMTLVSGINYQPIVDYFYKLYLRYITNPAAINSNIIATVFMCVLRHADDASEYDELIDFIKSRPQHERYIFNAIGRSCDPLLVKQTLKLMLTDSPIPMSNRATIFGSCATNPSIGCDRLAWDFLIENWEELYGLYSDTKYILGNIIPYAVGFVLTDSELSEVNAAFEAMDGKKNIQNTIAQCMEDITHNVSWRNAELN